MKKSILLFAACACMAASTLPGCGRGEKTEEAAPDTIPVAQPEPEPPFTHAEGNGVYYWRTVLTLDDAQRAYLKDNDVQRAYVRFFDVVGDDSPLATETVIPNATLVVRDTLHTSEIIPTIYITDDAIKRMKGQEEAWAAKIVRRVRAMCNYNDIPKLKEIQLDCDWTESTRDIFFNLCKAVRKELRDWERGDRVSSTIRLHQLRQTPPPVDYGVLMLYNTGSLANADEDNSILSVEKVKPYLRSLKEYPLHLDFAYPNYEWHLAFRGDAFQGILREPLPKRMLAPAGKNRHTLRRDTIIGDKYLRRGDVIRTEKSDPEVVAQVKALIEETVGTQPHSNIVYHLSPNMPKQ